MGHWRGTTLSSNTGILALPRAGLPAGSLPPADLPRKFPKKDALALAFICAEYPLPMPACTISASSLLRLNLNVSTPWKKKKTLVGSLSRSTRSVRTVETHSHSQGGRGRAADEPTLDGPVDSFPTISSHSHLPDWMGSVFQDKLSKALCG